MRSRASIYESMERSFLALQTSIKRLRQGSGIRALLFSVSNEIEKVFAEVDEYRRNMYIDTASGTFLDSLVSGFVKVKRKSATHASGYVVVELGEAITLDNLHLLKFSFAHYDKIANTVNPDFRSTIQIEVTKGDRRLVYYVCQPNNFAISERQFEQDPVTGEQRLLGSYKEYLEAVITATGKGIRKLVLPVVSEEPGLANNLSPEDINHMGNLGIPVLIKNSFNVVVEADDSITQDFSVADIDGVLGMPQGHTGAGYIPNENYRVLGDYSYITGGSNEEGDAPYRSRFYLYLNSLSRGTLPSLEYAVKTYVPNVKVKAVESGVPGIVTVYVDSPQVISKNLISRVNDIIRDYRSAGILVNLRPTKVEFINILVDLDADSLETASERIRGVLGNAMEGKDLAESVTYTDLHELMDIPEVRKTDNVYYGLTVGPETYSLYRGSIAKAFRVMSPSFDAAHVTVGQAEITPSYLDYLNSVMLGDAVLFKSTAELDSKPGEPEVSFPLVQLVRKAKDTDIRIVTDWKDARVIGLIQHHCGPTTRAGVCMEKIRKELKDIRQQGPSGNGEYPGAYKVDARDANGNIIYDSNDVAVQESVTELEVDIQMLEKMVGKSYSNYYKLKLMTLPPVRGLKAEEADFLITEFMHNDILNLSYEALLEASVGAFSKVRLSKNYVLNENLYKVNSLVGTRKIER